MGPLDGYRIIEIEGIGPCPFGGMLLADLGAEVIRVGRPEPSFLQANFDVMSRGKKSVTLNLKEPEGKDALLKLVKTADALIEGFRPGVMERLGIGPEVCMQVNPRLVFGRMTGWGQDGPWAKRAGHDINYISLAGALHAIGHEGERPTVPLNLVGDFGGGGLLLAFGMVCALLERERSGRGQVVDAAMLDGAISMMAMFCGFRAMGLFDDATGSNLLGGAAHFYDTYETADGRFLAVAPIEPEFYAEFLARMGVDRERFLPHGFRMGRMDSAQWDALKAELATVFRTRTRDEWCALFADSDACVTPVLGLSEAPQHPHNAARRNFVEVGGVMQNAPAPRFSRSATARPAPPPRPGADTRAVLAEAGYDAAALAALAEAGVIAPLEE